MVKKELQRKVLDEQVRRLVEVASLTTDSCTTATAIAFSDDRVKQLFWKKMSEGDVFRGISCPFNIEIPEQKSVLIEFECPPERFCFIDPSFLVVVNLVTRLVEAIVDPYIPREKRCVSAWPGNQAPGLVADSVSMSGPNHSTCGDWSEAKINVDWVFTDEKAFRRYRDCRGRGYSKIDALAQCGQSHSEHARSTIYKCRKWVEEYLSNAD